MRIDRTVARIRLRNPYEAVDLGFAFASRAGLALWLPWFLVSIAVFVGCNLVAWFAWQDPRYALLIFWWLKPLLDRVPLHVVSRLLFDDAPSLRETLGAVPKLWKQALPGALLWRRIDLARSLNLPVEQLEGLRGAASRRRKRLLQKTSRAAGVWLTMACIHLEYIFFASCVALVFMFTPIEFLPESMKQAWVVFVQEPGVLSQLAVNLLFFCGVVLIEPFYVCAGFALYLNRRTELEAWDIEIGFRRLAANITRTVSTVAASLVVAVGLVTWSPASHAEDVTEPIPSAEWRGTEYAELPHEASELESALQRAYADPFLSPVVESGHWQLRSVPEATGSIDWWPEWLSVPGWLLDLAALLIVFAGESFFWLLALAVIVFAVIHRRYLLDWALIFRTRNAPAQRTTVEIDVQRQDLAPDAIADAAASCWRAGQKREALALLYRGCVHVVGRAAGQALPEAATERDCLEQAMRAGEAIAPGITHIVKTWQAAAYGHRMPNEAAFDFLLETWRHQLEPSN